MATPTLRPHNFTSDSTRDTCTLLYHCSIIMAHGLAAVIEEELIFEEEILQAVIWSTEDDGDEAALEQELCMSAMMFASLDPYQMESNDNIDDIDDDVPVSLELESEIKSEGLRYLGGYIAFKFPQFQFLGSHVKAGEGTWNEAASHSKALMTPSDFFFDELHKMESYSAIRYSSSVDLN
ncbi:hypothetical protein Pmani_016558 [Petrolisthes manimaculis]|uniref:Uncharacterized protein n=1 Tax=Petrolisthes manimaculis TaxID=1843537 RepID=A0AAE1PRF8_9EUCA|nr:hypothetical protein Pmani_016558 [Petrolisthes manimaculis]